ncbi:ABC-type phosphate/phosphonate transport system permease subunit [Heliobacterium gestii]|nr:ABC-type phosphate/phosphonate transport system permease subunit [Heliomicrobium gestii]
MKAYNRWLFFVLIVGWILSVDNVQLSYLTHIPVDLLLLLGIGLQILFSSLKNIHSANIDTKSMAFVSVFMSLIITVVTAFLFIRRFQ